jgi:hypothetical protein
MDDSNNNNNNNDEEEEDDPADEMLREFSKIAKDMNDNDNKPTTTTSPKQQQPKNNKKLCIEFGNLLEPYTAQEAAELKAAATEAINDAIAAGVDDIQQLRAQLQQDRQKSQQTLNDASEFRAQVESKRLMNKIDQLTNEFMKSTRESREATQRAAAADAAEAGQGVELGVWGTLPNGMVIPTLAAQQGGGGGSALLGSVAEAAAFVAAEAQADETRRRSSAPTTKKILVLADTNSDALAKILLPALIEQWEMVLGGTTNKLVVETFAQTFHSVAIMLIV